MLVHLSTTDSDLRCRGQLLPFCSRDRRNLSCVQSVGIKTDFVFGFFCEERVIREFVFCASFVNKRFIP